MFRLLKNHTNITQRNAPVLMPISKNPRCINRAMQHNNTLPHATQDIYHRNIVNYKHMKPILPKLPMSLSSDAQKQAQINNDNIKTILEQQRIIREDMVALDKTLKNMVTNQKANTDDVKSYYSGVLAIALATAVLFENAGITLIAILFYPYTLYILLIWLILEMMYKAVLHVYDSFAKK